MVLLLLLYCTVLLDNAGVKKLDLISEKCLLMRTANKSHYEFCADSPT